VIDVYVCVEEGRDVHKTTGIAGVCTGGAGTCG
jgi:hypothetical protein